MIDLRTASVDEMRDWLAKHLGKKKCDYCGQPSPCTSHARIGGTPVYGTKPCPIPATLDAIAAVWRTELVGWVWERAVGKWWSYPIGNGAGDGGREVVANDTGDELADRLRLTCLALAAERGIK